MLKETAIPFAIGRDGAVATVTDPDAQIGQHINALIHTEPGERVMLPEYGVSTLGVLFETNPALISENLTTRAQASAALYEPGVQVNNVTTTGDVQEGVVGMNISYTRRDAPASGIRSANTNRAVVSIGGTVNEVISG
jgi:hypothetical protein